MPAQAGIHVAGTGPPLSRGPLALPRRAGRDGAVARNRAQRSDGLAPAQRGATRSDAVV